MPLHSATATQSQNNTSRTTSSFTSWLSELNDSYTRSNHHRNGRFNNEEFLARVTNTGSHTSNSSGPGNNSGSGSGSGSQGPGNSKQRFRNGRNGQQLHRGVPTTLYGKTPHIREGSGANSASGKRSGSQFWGSVLQFFVDSIVSPGTRRRVVFYFSQNPCHAFLVALLVLQIGVFIGLLSFCAGKGHLKNVNAQQ